MSTVQRPQLLPTASLQTLQPLKKKQVMLPDAKGIMHPHHVRPDTVSKIHAIVQAEEMMNALTQKPPATSASVQGASSLSSIPSTTSLQSSTGSFGSHFSQTSQGSDR